MKALGGFLVAAVLAGAGAFAWWRADPCLGRCGADTRCQAGRCVAAAPHAAAPVAPPTRKRRGRHGDVSAAAEVQLRPGDEKMQAAGDALGRPEHIDLSEPDARELTQEDLDSVFRGAQPAIERCISDAVGDAPLDTGRVEVGLRVEKSGAISRVRVEAPALMQHNGIYRCVRAAVEALRFPSSGGASVVTYPFELK